MSRYNGNQWPRYSVSAWDDDDYGEYSADAGDYWHLPDDREMGSLIRHDHRYVTVTGQIVTAPRVIKQAATMRDLRRIERARRSVLQRAKVAA